MAGTDTSSGSRKSDRTFQSFADSIKGIAARAKEKSESNPYGASYAYENPERFLQNPQDPFENVDKLRSRNVIDNQSTLSLANQARNDELSRQFQLQSAKDNSAARQTNSNIYEAQQKANIDANAYQRKLAIEQSSAPSKLFQPGEQSGVAIYQQRQANNDDARRQQESMRLQNDLSRSSSEADAYNQRLLTQMQGSQNLQQQYAQSQAQERLARINQQTSILSAGNAGESTWRWF